MNTINEVMGEKGLLSQYIANFAPRSQQIDMANAVSDTLSKGTVAVIEAGTGTGKTFAYLVPALLSGKRIIISTGTKNLQDQIFKRDLPLIRKIMGIPLTAAMLKGRANYICLYRLENVAPFQLKFSRQFDKDMDSIQTWIGRTKSGDVAELSAVKEDSPVWPYVTSSVDNCLGQDCVSYNECFLMNRRREAQKADILVINHHLFFADMALKDDGYGELLPGVSGVIFDEAHQIPGIASRFFSKNITSNQLNGLANDTLTEQEEGASDHLELAECAEELKVHVSVLKTKLEKISKKAGWEELIARADIDNALSRLNKALRELKLCLEIAAPRSKGLEGCWKRAISLHEQLSLHIANELENYIHWYEVFKRGFSFSLTPMHMSEIFNSYMAANELAWVFTSATLSVGDKFDYFNSELGLDLGLNKAKTLKLDSPFNFQQQVLLYLPEDVPEPNSRMYTLTITEMLLPVIKASQGRAFLLFTSYQALNDAHHYLRDKVDYEILVQGSMPRSNLLDRFRKSGNAILIGTSSFWEGVDVRGDALSCVIIDKLPFASPGDPILQARMKAMREDGRNPFMEYQLPQAVISLKQGFGRLIRDVTDRGVVMLCDPRIKTKAYGKLFLQSLPKTSVTQNVTDVENFFAEDLVVGNTTEDSTARRRE